MDNQSYNEIIKIFKDQQQRYAYYIIALCVAAIAFAIQKTIGVGMKVSQLPLAGAAFCWSISILCGLKFLKLQMAAAYSNAALLQVQAGNDPDVGQHPAHIKVAVQTILKGIEKKSKATMRLANWQDRLFFVGIFLFILWHVWEMYSYK